jgi:hypothetical protein
MRIALVACAKDKSNRLSPAKDLYQSPLFRKARAYAENKSDRWYILSAKHGVLDPNRRIHPYDVTLGGMSIEDRRRWGLRVQRQLADVVSPRAAVIILAGMNYRRPIVAFLRAHGCVVSVPLKGLGIGKQLKRLNRLLASS